VVGQCFGPESSKGKIAEVFISPTLEQPLEVAGTLCHELAHVAAGCKAAHGKGFTAVCKAVGLTKGKPFTVMPGPALEDQLRRVVERVGPYPHTGIVPVARLKNVSKKSRLSLVCPKCGCKIQISIKDMDKSGSPVCGCGVGFVEVDDAEG
jgi:hypothetical protein